MAPPGQTAAWPLLAWAVVLAGLGAVLLARAAPPLAAQDNGGRAAALQRGARLYAGSCAECHAADGSGDIGPSLRDVVVPYIDLVLRTGRMPPESRSGEGYGGDWSDAEREAIVAYTAEEFDLQGRPPAVTGGDPAVGRRVWMGNCAACHGSTGAGGVAGGGTITPRIAGLDPVTIAEAVRVGPFQMPAFDRQQLTDEDIGAVTAYMDEVAHEQGTPLGLTELNPVYASGAAFLMVVVVVLSLLWMGGEPVHFPNPPEDGEELGRGEGTDT
ncbi:MAG: cytochrome c [Actinomycetota bacterium]|nr:cytochrome c [Actinomycetota bacterium]